MCHDVAESYGAAWLIHHSKFMAMRVGRPWTEVNFNPVVMADPTWSIERNVTFASVNMEGASHIVLKKTQGAYKTVDAFDFYGTPTETWEIEGWRDRGIGDRRDRETCQETRET